MKDIRGYFGQTWPTREGWKADCPRCGNPDRTFNWNETKQVGCCFHASCPWYYQNGGVTAGRVLMHFSDSGFEYQVPERIVVAEEADLKLPESFKVIKEQEKGLQETLYAYLSHRGIPRTIVDRAKLGYCTKGSQWGYIIIPVFEDGEVVYWQGRRFKDRKLKFYNPKSSVKDEILYCISQTRRPRTGIIVESAINTLTLESVGRGKTIIWALLCKTLSDSQLDKILYHERYLEEVVVALDGDARRDAVMIAERLASTNIIRQVKIASFPITHDINELGREKSWEIIRRAPTYDRKRRMEFMIA